MTDPTPPDARPRVVVVGGGITGLATAYYLRRSTAAERFEVVLLEAASRPGGKLRTECRDGFLIEAGPDSFLTGKPAAVELCRELGLAQALIPQQQPRAAYVLRRGRLVPIPAGMRLVHPTRPWALLRSPLLSPAGRIRALAHPLMPPRRGAGDADESVGAFVQRRYGAELLRVLGEPLLAGIHLADPWQLSLAATFPALRVAPRRGRTAAGTTGPAGAPTRHGSTPRSGEHRPVTIPPAELSHLHGSPFASLAGGMEQLSSALALRLGRSLRTDTAVAAIFPTASGYRVRLQGSAADRDGEELAATAVVVTAPAAAAAQLVTHLNPPLAQLLIAAEATSSAIVTLGYRDPRVAFPLPGSGFLVPRGEGSRLLACTWSSAKWAGRAPAGGVLVRVFVGGWRHPELLEQADGELIALVQAELAAILGGGFAQCGTPAVRHVQRWQGGTPLYRVGHREWLSHVHAACAAAPGLWLAGAPYDGVGIPDCVRQAHTTAAAVASYLTGPSRGALSSP